MKAPWFIEKDFEGRTMYFQADNTWASEKGIATFFWSAMEAVSVGNKLLGEEDSWTVGNINCA